jgi:ribosome-binding factor A
MKQNDSLRRWCAQLQDDDGVDPRRYFAKSRKGQNDHRTRQLCRQVFRALSLIVPEFNDPILQDIHLTAVVPAPDASRLLVRFESRRTLSDREREKILAGLDRIRGPLRGEVARAITRRRTPDLTFELTGSAGGAS